MLRLAVTGTLLAAPTLRAADPLVDGAVTALAQLTDPQRLEKLPDPAFRAQLGPALGWLHVARRRDVAPEAVIGRALALNGLDSERARLTRDALLRNLARADAWELFVHEASARALADGRPAQILAGIHRGHLAQTAIVAPENAGQREFACLTLCPDDEMPRTSRPVPAVPQQRAVRQAGDMLARAGSATPVPRRPARHITPAASGTTVPVMPVAYDDALPVAYTALGPDSPGAMNVRVEVHPGQPVDLGAYGGPPISFLLRDGGAGTVRFSLLDAQTSAAGAPVRTVALDRAHPQGQPIYEQAGTMRISLCGPPAADGARTLLFELLVRPQRSIQARPAPPTENARPR